MPQSSNTANIKGDIGQLTVGNHIIKIGSHGTRANIATEQPTVSSRPTPVLIQPTFDQLLDRKQSILEAIAALQTGQSVEFCSPAGFGKTVLLLAIALEATARSSFPDGVISLSPHQPQVADLLHSIWSAFYESNLPYKPTDNQIRQQIQDKQALIVLDDDGKLIKYEVEELMNAAGKCTFLIASSTSRIQQKGLSIQLKGLDLNDALALVEGELQRSLKEEELKAAKSLCTILKGHPMHIRIAVASIREDDISFADVVSRLPTEVPSNYFIQQIVASLSQSQRSVLELLAVMGESGLQREQIIAITKLPDTVDALLSLCRRHIVQFDSRYSISKTIVEVLPPEWQLTAPLVSTVAYFINWTQQHQQQPKTLLSEIDAIAHIIEVAVTASRWSDVLCLVKAVEGSIALSRRWGLWKQVLQRGLQASQAEQDKAAEAWALHQLGTCALCQQDNASANNYLNAAIKLRESLGDSMGVSVSRHNLNLLPNTGEVSQLGFLQNMISRMTVVVNPTHSEQPVFNNVLPSLTKVITTGILASGGLLAWFNWHRFIPLTGQTPSESVSSPTPITKPKAKATKTPASIAKPKPEGTVTFSPIPKPIPTIPFTLSPIPKHTPKIDPPLTPKIEFQKPPTRKLQKPKIKPKYTPIPLATPTPAVMKPKPTPALQQPTVELTPTPTPTPQQPSVELTPTPTPTPEEPRAELTPTPITPTPTPASTPKAEAIPDPAVTITPLVEPIN